MKDLYVLDAYAIIYRSYFAFLKRPLRNSKGENVSAVYGFFRTLFQLWDVYAPEAFAAVFDSRVPTFRHEMYAEYKATRQKTPEDLHAQVPLVEEILAALGVPALRCDGYEADDVIATLAARCEREGRQCYIVSGDKDLLQLVGATTRVLKPDREQGFTLMGAREVEAEWSLAPERILDYLSLAGDSSDNIPGVPGVGDKTAVKLLSEFGSFDELWRNIERVAPETLRKKLEAGKESAFFSRKLATLATDAPVTAASLDELSVGALDRNAAAPLFLREGMISLVPAAAFRETAVQRDLFREPEAPAAASAAQAQPAGSYELVLSEARLTELCREAEAQGVFAFDCETDSLDEMAALPVGFSLALSCDKGFYIPLVAPDCPVLDATSARRVVARLLKRADIIVVGQNLKFDMHVMENWGAPIHCTPWDTMIAAWLIDPERDSFKLEKLGMHYLGFSGTAYDELVPKGGVFSQLPIDKAAPYAAEDAYMTLRLKAVLEKELHEKKLTDLFASVEMPLVSVLARMEREGVLLDAAQLERFGLELDDEIKKIEAETFKLVGHEFNVNSPKQLQEVLFVERKLSTGKKTKTGYSTDVSVLEELAAEDKVPELILRFRTLQKLKSTYVDGLLVSAASSPRIRTHFMQTGTATGRLSSRDPNLQNIPIRDDEGRRIRKAFIAAPGKTLVSADYSQIELVVFAHLSGDDELKKAFTEGADIHRRTAALIFGKHETEVTQAERRAAKTINFGVIYGMSAFRLARELGIKRAEAQGFIDAYFTRYRGVAAYMTRCIEEAQETGYVTTILGRRRPVSGINSRNGVERAAAERIAVNTPVQGSAADIVKLAMLKTDALLKKSFKSAKLLLQVHDELILEVESDKAEALARALEKNMSEAIELSVSLRVGVETAHSWGDMH